MPQASLVFFESPQFEMQPYWPCPSTYLRSLPVQKLFMYSLVRVPMSFLLKASAGNAAAIKIAAPSKLE
jgi:hypothetical protein